MKIKLPYGTTAENDQLLLEPGFLSFDIEKKAIRIHDGLVQGGFEALGQQAYVIPFRGEISTNDLITGDDLAELVGLTTGISQNSDAGWLHFVEDGVTKYVAKRPLRHSISWDDLNTRELIYGERMISINNESYRIRLMRGANSDPMTLDTTGSYDHPGTHGSEWNRLLYRISGKPFSNGGNKLSSEGIEEGDWAQYSELELGVGSGNGSRSWCQEAQGTLRLTRGGLGVSQHYRVGPTSTAVSTGWRPVLELID